VSTTIDSLDIQIRSSAGSAANNIEELAIALGDLKSAANLTKITNQLGKLKTSLDGLRSVNAGIQNLEKFGRTISKLSSFTADVSGFSKAVNTLRKLPALAGELKGLDLGGLPEKMQSIENALAGLSGIAKPQGLTSAVNALKKIPEVTNALDVKTIDEFGDKIERLAAKLGPLAIQIEKVGSGFAKLPSQVSKTVTATNRMEKATESATRANKEHSKSLNTTSINLMSVIQNLQEVTQAIHFVADGAANVLNDAMQWDGIQFRFGRAFGEDAEEVLAYSDKITEKLGINQQQFMQYSSMYGSLLSGFGMAQEQVTTISVGLAELSYDIWAAYNDRYQSLEDASEAVRSAITGEIEPIRNAGIALTEASMQEYLDSLGMAEIKMSKLSEAQKSEVRYATMVNSAMNQGIVGTYAAEMNTAEGVMRNLAIQTKTLAQNFGSLFIPILMKVIPYVTAFVQILTDATRAVAGFFGVELQEINWDKSSSGLGGVADDASDAAGALKDAGKEAKKLKDYTMGFDELNIIDPDKGSDSSGGSGGGAGGVGTGGSLGLDLDTLWDDSVFAKAKQDVDKLKEKLKDMLGIAGDIAIIIGSWMVAGKLLDFVDWLKDPKAVGNFKKKAGIALMISGFTFEFAGAYDIGLNGANFQNVLKTALGAAMGIAGSLLVFGTGPAGWAIGIGTALTLLITGITLGVHKKNLLEDQKAHFGEYVLSEEELDEMVKKLTTSETSMRLDLYLDQKVIVNDAEKALEAAMGDLQKLNMKIQIGLEVSQETYAAAVDNLLENISKYINEKQLGYALAIDVTLEGTETGARLTEFSNAFFLETQGKLTDLGNKLKKVVSEGFRDGEWIPEKLAEAIRLQTEIQEVLDYVSDKEFQAKMKALKLDASSAALSFESLTELLTRASDTISEKMENLEEVRLSQIQIAEMEFDQNVLDGMSEKEAKKILDTTLAEIQDQFLAAKWELETGPVTFGLDTIKEAYSDELKKTVPFLKQSTEEMFLQGTMAVLPEETYDNVDNLVMQLHDAYKFGFQDMDISTAARENIETLLEAMTPTLEDTNKIAAEARKAGKTVPEEVSKALADAAQLGAINDNVDAINYLIGKKLSTDDSFLNVLATAEGAGERISGSIGDGLLDNVNIIYDETGKVMLGIENTVTGEVTKMTPTLYQNMKDMGVNLVDGLQTGTDTQMENTKGAFEKIFTTIGTTFRELFDINSPSKVFEDYGKDLMDGLHGGVDESTVQKDYVGVFGRLNTWFEKTFGIGGGKSSVFSGFGSVLGGSLSTSISEKWEEIKTWFSTNVASKFTKEFWTGKFSGLKDGFGSTIKNMVNTGIEYINKFIGWLNEKMRFSWDAFEIAGQEIIPGGSIQLFTIPKLPKLATGGFVNEGQMFIAREAGPELVGSINGRTSVANNDQIVEAVSQGVYNAVMAAMGNNSNGSGEQNINVYLDGKAIYSSVKKTENERGRTLMGSQLGYGY
jgi:hypothetical protein